MNRLLIALLSVLVLGMAFASSIGSLSITTGTVYQNGNTTNPLYINVETLGSSQGYVGATSGNLLQVYNLTEAVYGVVGASITHNISAFAVVPPSYYYEANYVGGTVFQGTYASTFAGTPVFTAGAGISISASNVISNIGVTAFDSQTGNVIGVSSINGVSNAITTNTLGGIGVGNFIAANILQFQNTNKTGSGSSTIYTAGNGITISTTNVISANVLAPLTVNALGIGLGYDTNNMFLLGSLLDIKNLSTTGSQFLKSITAGNYGINVFCSGQSCSVSNNGVLQYNGNNGLVNAAVNSVTAGNTGIVVSCTSGVCSVTNNGVLLYNSQNGIVFGVNSINGVSNAITFNTLGGLAITNGITTNSITLANTNITSGSALSFNLPLINNGGKISLLENAPITNNAAGYLSVGVGTGLAVNTVSGQLVNTNTSSASGLTFNAPLKEVAGTVYLAYNTPLYLTAANMLSSTGGSSIYLFLSNTINESMLYEFFAALAVFFLIIRFFKVQQANSFAIAFDALSGMFMFFALYFILFPVNPTSMSNSIITQNGTAAIHLVTNMTTNAGPSFFTNAPQIIEIAIGLWLALVLIISIFDIFNVYFPKKGQLPKMPGMPGG